MEDYKIDLHVHTPASRDYRGQRGRVGMIQLLRDYKQASVSAIAMTDHNSINGYRSYIEEKRETELNFRLNSRRDASSKFVDELKSEVGLFSSLSIIPGVEISCFPSVHLILLFSEDVDLNEVDRFLISEVELGEDAVKFGDPAKVSPYSPTVVLAKARQVFGDSFFGLLPHIDSSNGAWRELKDCGAARAELFRDESILCCQIVNPQEKGRVVEALSNPAYQRDKPIVFIQASDYHGGKSAQAANQYSRIHLPNSPRFSSLRDAFVANETVRISSDFVDKEIESYVDGKLVSSFDFQNNLEVSETRKMEIAKALCAVLNTEDCLLKFEVRNIPEEPGIIAPKIGELIEELTEAIDSSQPFEFSIVSFQHSQNRQTYFVECKNRRVRLFEGAVWILSPQGIRSAKSWEIEQRVAQNFFNRYGRPKQKSLEKSAEDLLMISSSLPAFPMASALEGRIRRDFQSLFDIDFVGPTYTAELSDLREVNGLPDGNVYIFNSKTHLKGGRQFGEEADYFRFTTPVYNGEDFNLPETSCSPESGLFLLPNGGVTYFDKPKSVYAPFPLFVITIDKDSEVAGKQQSEQAEFLRGLAAYLKSSFVLWYIATIYQTSDLSEMILRRGRVLPLPKDLVVMNRLGRLALTISDSEKALLGSLAKRADTDAQRSARFENIKKHNQTASQNMRHIDKEVFRAIGFGRKEIAEVFRVIRQLDIYDFGIGEDLKGFIDEVLS